ncbi:hypothetical protein ASPBRDRAFT_546271 [Aspergillus brasiliensis CBS 101740]|uniref:Secreted protein n=1 Tax=Aspergillus brasiliensis (strain CBS 101740 / IMI 381727 / IBT 21946) TaxID=767769 RepID=A0A1L9ULG8_ASPBC|nr:hypothetical protein ASPBRDRAFT_546271 [Aspergillus brasiliensis CBS 101740]
MSAVVAVLMLRSKVAMASLQTRQTCRGSKSDPMGKAGWIRQAGSGSIQRCTATEAGRRAPTTENYRFSARAVIYFLRSRPPKLRVQLHNMLVREDHRLIALPGQHAIDFIPFCQENPAH